MAPAPVPHLVDELCDYWLENRATKKRSEKDDRCIIEAGRTGMNAIPLHPW